MVKGGSGRNRKQTPVEEHSCYPPTNKAGPDLILCAAIPRNEGESQKLGTTLNSIDHLKFNNKYILFDGAPVKASESKKKLYRDLRKVVAENSDFTVIEYLQNLYYKPMLEKFIREHHEVLNDNLFIIQDDVEFDPEGTLFEVVDADPAESSQCLEEVIQDKETIPNCKILYFGENKEKAVHWFTTIDEDAKFVRTHGWSERVYIAKKKDLLEIFDFLKKVKRGGRNGKFIEAYYQNAMKRKSWKLMDEDSKLEYWGIWGCYEYKNVFHKHLNMKR